MGAWAKLILYMPKQAILERKNDRNWARDQQKCVLRPKDHTKAPNQMVKWTIIGTKFTINQEGGTTNMCKAWEDQRKEDLQTGIEFGRKHDRKRCVEAKWAYGKQKFNTPKFYPV